MKGVSYMPKAIDITGQRFGKLVAIKRVPSRNYHTYWLCKCDCGNEKEIQTAHLTSGATTSCGCEHTNVFTEYNKEKICILCKKPFIANNYKRVYCYDCAPSGLDAADLLRYKKRALKHQLIEYKGGKCEKCGYNKCEGALQFHHRDPKQKEFALSQINLNDTNFSIEKVYQEIDKCDLLCANCHAEEHYIKD